MQRWAEVVLVLAVVALGVRFLLPRADSVQPSKVEEKEPDPLGGYAIVGAEPGKGAIGFLDDPRGGYRMWGRELTRGSGVILAARDSRQDVQRVLGKPVAFNSDDSIWGYWTRGLPNSKMGILVRFDRHQRVDLIELHTDWSRLAVELANPRK